MKFKFLALAFAAAAVLVPFAARADEEVSFQSFYDNLSPYGEWIEVGDYGDCWHPTGVDADWAPYTDGYWSYTDAGWTWVSYEDFGDICYHYGRWVDVTDVGWCWVPDQEWGPAWVSWRQDDEYIGWAPLPPEARWRPSVGFSVWVDDYCDIGPSYYNFCPIVEFSAPVIRHVCVPRVAVVNIFARCVNITNICWNGHHNVVFCGGPNFTVINTRLRRPIPTLKLVQNTTIVNNNVTIINNKRVVKFPHAKVAGNTLNVFAPKVVNKNVVKPQIAKTVQKEKVNRGWQLENQVEVAKLREKVKSEAKGLNPDTAPAKPVQVADLKPVPEKADPTAPSPVADRGNRRAGKDTDNNDNKLDRIAADRPGKGQGDGNATNRPGKVAGDQPGRGPDAGDKPGRPDANDDNKPGKVAGRDDNDKRGRGQTNPLVRPFNEPNADRDAGQGGGKELGKREGGASNNDGTGQIDRQRQVAERQRQEREERIAEAERQLGAAQRADRLQRAEARQRQLEAQRNRDGGDVPERAQRPPQPQRDQAEHLQNQAERQQQMQRQAELQQRQQQAQRQQQLLNQRQQQRQPQQIQRQQGQSQGQGQAQGQGNGQGGQGGRRQITPEEREALQKQQQSRNSTPFTR